MKKGDIVNYFGKYAEVVDLDTTHVLIIFKSGIKICTNKNVFSK